MQVALVIADLILHMCARELDATVCLCILGLNLAALVCVCIQPVHLPWWCELSLGSQYIFIPVCACAHLSACMNVWMLVLDCMLAPEL